MKRPVREVNCTHARYMIGSEVPGQAFSAGVGMSVLRAVMLTALLSVSFLSLHVALAGGKKTEVKRLSVSEVKGVIRENKGKVVVLNFWSTLLSDSKQERAFLNTLYNAYDKSAFEIISVNVEGVEPEVIAPFVEMVGARYPVFVGGDDVVEAYDIQFIPITFVLGRNGKVKLKEPGFTEKTKQSVKRTVEGLLAEE
ncbi:MAG: TlpA family protein disulfide reductase [Planctomycetes bacterium]|nr:TlpA family protein disulfide reductase [Planctomycetota bacterium]